MNKKIITILIILIALIGSVLLIIGNKNQNPQEVKESIRIGVVGPLTGDAAVYGEPAKHVMQIATNQINANDGIKGQSIELVFEDGKCTGKDAVAAAHKLIEVDRVQVIIGGVCSSESLAMVPIAKKSKVLLLSAVSSSPDLTGASQYFTRIFPSDASQGVILAEQVNAHGYKNIAALIEEGDYPLGIYTVFEKKLTDLRVHTTKELVTSDATDFRTVLSKLQTANPDILFIDVQAAPMADLILKELQDMNWDIPLMFSETVASDAPTMKKYASLTEDSLAATIAFDENQAILDQLIATYQQTYHTDLPYHSYSLLEYDSVYLIKDAITAVGYDGTKMADWLRTHTWNGATGIVKINPDGDRESGHKAHIIKSGVLELAP